MHPPLILRLPLIVSLSGLAGLAMLLPAAHATVLGDHHVAQAFLYSGAVVLILVAMLSIALANRRIQLPPRMQLAALVGVYFGLPVVMALPFAQALHEPQYINAWFEMISAFTTTGATIYDIPGRLSPSLHLWRALVGWFGGFFTLLSATAILAPMSLGGFEVVTGGTLGHLGRAHSGESPEVSARLMRSGQFLLPFYTGLTLTLWLCLMLAGEDNLLALVHAMGTISTSGIGMDGDLDVLRSGIKGEMLIFLFLIFALSRRFWPAMPTQTSPEPRYKDPELRLALALIGMVTAVMVLRHFLAAAQLNTADDLPKALGAFWGAMFTALSFLTTTGYESGQWSGAQQWSGLSNPGLVLLGLAMVGGGVATTAGGVKLLRLYALLRHGERELERMIHPNSVGGQGQYARMLRNQGGYFAWLFFMLFALSISVSTLAVTLTGQEFEQALILTLASLCSTGALADLAGPNIILYSQLSESAKSILAVMMVVGRLETLAILALLAPSGWRG